MTGRTLAHYEVAEKLGEGGMGMVYKARDLHLDRFVGIKFLRADKHRDAERKRRFIFEAKAASALNHPNIITIHDAGTVDDTDYIVMEYVKGQTLASLISRRGMPLGDVLKYGIQIADALAAAHSAGIVHRDLKPANVMIAATDGRVKVLDFGLAKLTEVVTPDPDELTQTIRADDTEEGQILGTTAYMAPEQVEGKKVDARTDIFAFGLMLYEMVTGKRAFERDSRMGTLTAILKEQQTPVGDLVTGVPNELDKIVARCLRKDPDRRYQTMRDVANALQELKEDSESGRLAAPLTTQAKPKSRRTLVAAVSAVAVLAIALIAVVLWRRSPANVAPLQLKSRALTSDSSANVDPTISRDGRLVAYASNRGGSNNLDIWLQPLTEGTPPIRLTRHEADDTQPDFSPDGGLIVFRSARNGGGLYVIPTYGGEERLLVRGGMFPRFSPDGKTIVYATHYNPLQESIIQTIPVAGGQPTRLAVDTAWGSGPVFSPDGTRVLFAGYQTANSGEYDYWSTPVNGGPSLRTGINGLVPRASILSAPGLDWFEDRLYLRRDNRIWSVAVNPDGRPAGSAHEITYAIGAGAARVARANDGPRMVFASGSRSFHLWRQKIDWNQARTLGDLEPLPHTGASQDFLGGTSLTRKFVYTQIEPQGYSIRLRDLGTGSDVSLASVTARARLSPDGANVAYVNFPERGLFLVPATGGNARKLAVDKSIVTIWNWYPDNSRIVYYGGSPVRFFTYNLATGANAVLLSHPTLPIHGAEVSPDMKWIAFHTPDGDESPVFITPVRDGQGAPEQQWIRIADKGNNRRPWWSPDGRLLYFRSERDGFSCLWAQRLDPARKHPQGEPFAVTHLHNRRLSGTFGPTILPDQMVVSMMDTTTNITLAEFKQ